MSAVSERPSSAGSAASWSETGGRSRGTSGRGIDRGSRVGVSAAMPSEAVAEGQAAVGIGGALVGGRGAVAVDHGPALQPVMRMRSPSLPPSASQEWANVCRSMCGAARGCRPRRPAGGPSGRCRSRSWPAGSWAPATAPVRRPACAAPASAGSGRGPRSSWHRTSRPEDSGPSPSRWPARRRGRRQRPCGERARTGAGQCRRTAAGSPRRAGR